MWRISRTHAASGVAKLMLFCTTALAGDLVVKLPADIHAESISALTPGGSGGDDNPVEEATVSRDENGQSIARFSQLEAGTPYDICLVLGNGVELRGVNMAWYTAEPAKADAGPMDDDDREQIRALVTDVKSFYNISRIMMLSGDHDRATVLVERARTTAFHSDTGQEAIWRVELWYFKNEFGGWQEIPQTSKVLVRKRFDSTDEYQAAVSATRWLPSLGGVVLDKNGASRAIEVTREMVKGAASKPAR
jgi:hypothetical protein